MRSVPEVVLNAEYRCSFECKLLVIDKPLSTCKFVQASSRIVVTEVKVPLCSVQGPIRFSRLMMTFRTPHVPSFMARDQIWKSNINIII